MTPKVTCPLWDRSRQVVSESGDSRPKEIVLHDLTAAGGAFNHFPLSRRLDLEFVDADAGGGQGHGIRKRRVWMFENFDHRPCAGFIGRIQTGRSALPQLMRPFA